MAALVGVVAVAFGGYASGASWFAPAADVEGPAKRPLERPPPVERVKQKMQEGATVADEVTVPHLSDRAPVFVHGLESHSPS